MAGDAEICRCPWPGTDPLYVSYHDEEWGVPKSDDLAFFEKMILEGFQSGLSWITVLRKREAFRAAFDGFDPEKMVRYDDEKVAALLQNSGIIRHRGKIEAAIGNASAYLAMRRTRSLTGFFWNFVDGAPAQNNFAAMSDIPAETPLSQRISKELKAQGFRFCGPVTVYSLMQACGLVNDHLTSCYRHAECATLMPRSEHIQK